MKKVYCNDTGITIKVHTGHAFKDGESASVVAIKPDGSRVTFEAAVTDAEKGELSFDLQEGSCFDVKGWWKLFAVVQLEDGRTCRGSTAKLFVYE